VSIEDLIDNAQPLRAIAFLVSAESLLHPEYRINSARESRDCLRVSRKPKCPLPLGLRKVGGHLAGSHAKKKSPLWLQNKGGPLARIGSQLTPAIYTAA